eukprot:COSAG02_NODE_1320_length_13269_cov_11.420058_3_plen_74_part_00
MQSTPTCGLPPTWHTAEELTHADHIVEIVGDGTLSQWTVENPQRAVHFAAHRAVSTVSRRFLCICTIHVCRSL